MRKAGAPAGLAWAARALLLWPASRGRTSWCREDVCDDRAAVPIPSDAGRGRAFDPLNDPIEGRGLQIPPVQPWPRQAWTMYDRALNRRNVRRTSARAECRLGTRPGCAMTRPGDVCGSVTQYAIFGRTAFVYLASAEVVSAFHSEVNFRLNLLFNSSRKVRLRADASAVTASNDRRKRGVGTATPSIVRVSLCSL